MKILIVVDMQNDFVTGVLGTEEAVSAVTPSSLYEMLDFILKKCPAEAVFAGKFSKDAEKTDGGYKAVVKVPCSAELLKVSASFARRAALVAIS